MERLITALILAILYFSSAEGIRCYHCNSELLTAEYDACLYGDERYLPVVKCQEPSVCVSYYYETDLNGATSKLSMTRGCQAVRFGPTCEDIFNDLRRTGSVLPGQHTCATCTEDLCNLAHISRAGVLLVAVLGLFGTFYA